MAKHHLSRPDDAQKSVPTWRRVAPFMLLGPITGPLVAGLLINLREGRPVLAMLYGIALAEASFLLPYVAGRLGLHFI
jgi:hypothetical protein